jgi:hypothetical protein
VSENVIVEKNLSADEGLEFGDSGGVPPSVVIVRALGSRAGRSSRSADGRRGYSVSRKLPLIDAGEGWAHVAELMSAF